MNACTGTIQFDEKSKQFREKRNKVKRSVVRAKREYTLLKMKNNADNPRKYWAELNHIMPSGKSKMNKDPNYLNDETNQPTEPNKTSAYTNEFFENIGPALANEITINNKANLERLNNFVPERSLSDWKPIDVDELVKAVKELDVNKNSNIENINTVLLRDCRLCTIQQVVHLFNLILVNGRFQDSWKRATVIPLFKAGNKLSVSNYRPISLLPCMGELLEKTNSYAIISVSKLYKFFYQRPLRFSTKYGHYR